MTSDTLVFDKEPPTEKGTRMSPQEKAQAYQDFKTDFRYLESILIQAQRQVNN